MLDSSPVALPPPIPRPLKRSASTASLPTPPRSCRKLAKRGRSSRGSCDHDSDSGEFRLSPPVTPTPKTTRSSSTKRGLVRDSPDNPFLATEDHDDDDTFSHSDSSADHHEPLPERPTVSYVLYVFSPILYVCLRVCINDLLFLF